MPRTEDIFRIANDEIAAKGSELGWQFPVPFLCECSNQRCFTRLELTLEAYAELRSHPSRYLIAPGHEITDAFVIEEREHLAVAEKLYATH